MRKSANTAGWCASSGKFAGSPAADEMDDFDLGAGRESGFGPKTILYYFAVEFDGDSLRRNGQNCQKASNRGVWGHLAGFAVNNNLNHFCLERGREAEFF